nr:hypothetical protein [Tanacetum cinerariifolium]
MVDDDDDTSKDKEIDKLMALISLSFKKIYKPTNNNLQTSSNTTRANQDNSPRINRNAGYESQMSGNVAEARETVEQADWKNDTDDQELEAHYMYMAKIQEQSESIHETYLIEQDAHNMLIESLDMNYDSEQIDQNDEDADLAKEQMELECAKVRGDFLSYKMKSEKSCNKYTQTINDLNQTILEMKNKLSAHQDTISILKQQKDAQIKLYKTREDKELEKVIELENKVKVLDNIVYKIGQSVLTMNMLNNKCRTSFLKPEYLKKAKQANPRLYDIGCYNDNLALMLAPESDEVIRLEKESRSKLSDLIEPFNYTKLNNLYDLFVPQREKSRINAGLDLFLKCLNEEMVVDLRYFNSLELEVDSLTSQLETQRTQFVNEIDRLSREYYYADHMHAILGVYTELDEVTNLQ